MAKANTPHKAPAQNIDSLRETAHQLNDGPDGKQLPNEAVERVVQTLAKYYGFSTDEPRKAQICQ